MEKCLAGKVVFLSGASSGIGRAIAVRMAQMGASVVATTGHNLEGLNETLGLLEKSLPTQEHTAMKMDVTCSDEVNAVLKRDERGEPLLIRTTVFDATDRRRYEQELLSAIGIVRNGVEYGRIRQNLRDASGLIFGIISRLKRLLRLRTCQTLDHDEQHRRNGQNHDRPAVFAQPLRECLSGADI